MNLRTHVPLAPLTTFGVGGAARYFIEASSEEDVRAAIAFAKEKGIPFRVLGAGSNLLVPDTEVAGLVIRMRIDDLAFEAEGTDTLLIAGAGVPWDVLVDAATARGLSGIENLAGIPGTVGGAAVQNIGAYGAELANVFAYAEVLDTSTGEIIRVLPQDARFAYRTSVFKTHRTWIIMRVALRLSTEAPLNMTYADLARAQEAGTVLATPADVAAAVREIRKGKMPDLSVWGTAGSFFKNPVIETAAAEALTAQYPEFPTYPGVHGTKISLAWLLDRVLALKGYAHGGAHLYEKQPLIIVAQKGTAAADVDALAREVSARVHEATGITIEREVETFNVGA